MRHLRKQKQRGIRWQPGADITEESWLFVLQPESLSTDLADGYTWPSISPSQAESAMALGGSMTDNAVVSKKSTQL